MIKSVAFASLLIAGAFAACSKRDTPPPASEPTAERTDATAAHPGKAADAPAIDACKLLSNEEITSVQGQAPARTQPVGQSDGQLSVSQCNFLLPIATNSVSLRVVERGDGPKRREPKQVWQETFHANQPDAPSSAKARKPQKVDGVGEEAFWLGDVKRGGLYVLKGNRYIKLSVGGKEDLETKIAKCSRLSAFVLSRLDTESSR